MDVFPERRVVIKDEVVDAEIAMHQRAVVGTDGKRLKRIRSWK
jgi:hypothetical protein